MTIARLSGRATAHRRVLFGGAGLLLVIASSLLPHRVAHADTLECKSYDYSCLSGFGYAGQTAWGSDPDHNCVSYVGYRLTVAGGSKPWDGQIGNANQWDDKARAADPSYLVNEFPVVGSVYQTDAGTYGHIAMVDAVTATTITISEDAYLPPGAGASYSARRVLDRNGAEFKKAVFIHIKDSAHKRGDADGDGRVNVYDLSSLLSRDGQRRPNGDDLAGDFSHDGTIGAADLAILLANWTW